MKFIKSLHLKKNRDKEGLFLVEGAKSVLELLKSDFTVQSVLASPDHLQHFKDYAKTPVSDWLEVDKRQLNQVGTLVSNNAAVAVVEQKSKKEKPKIQEGLELILDNLNDPGNLGTIIRTADWFGITQLILGDQSVDIYNPKVVSASKGSLFRVNCFIVNLEQYLSNLKIPIIAAEATGTPLKMFHIPNRAALLMGSESHGVSDELRPYITQSVAITGSGSTESLNVGIATGILLNAWFQEKV